jgi:hypothetical protein
VAITPIASLTGDLIVAGVAAAVGGVVAILGQREVEHRKAKREEEREDTAGRKAATAAARAIRSKIINARKTLEAIGTGWPPGDQFALHLRGSDFHALEGYLDDAAWAAITETQDFLESIHIRCELAARDPTQYRPDGENSRQLLVGASESLLNAERALQPLIGELSQLRRARDE